MEIQLDYESHALPDGQGRATQLAKEFAMRPRFKFRNPPFKYRVLIVAGFLSLPGTVAGAIASLFFGGFAICVIIGAVIGAFTGAWLEAGADILHRDE